MPQVHVVPLLAPRPKILSASQRSGLSQPRKGVHARWRSASLSSADGGVRVHRRRRQAARNAAKEIRRAQQYSGHAIPQASFVRLVKRLTEEHGPQYRFQGLALEVLQEAAESFLVQLLQDGVLLAQHARRVTLMDRDIVLLVRILRPRWAARTA